MLERSYNVTWKLKLKSDPENVVGEVLYLMEVPPDALKYNL